MANMARAYLGTAELVAASASALPSSPVATSRAKPAAAKIYMQRSGTGNREISSMMVPPKSSVVWRFDSQNAPKKRGTFVLSSTEQGRSAVELTDQTGLGGGGQKPFMQTWLWVQIPWSDSQAALGMTPLA
jgi:hypothetical protein